MTGSEEVVERAGHLVQLAASRRVVAPPGSPDPRGMRGVICYRENSAKFARHFELINNLTAFRARCLWYVVVVVWWQCVCVTGVFVGVVWTVCECERAYMTHVVSSPQIHPLVSIQSHLI